jgi:hypothetical protein
MYPSLVAEEAKAALTEYLSTTFALAEDEERSALEEFLTDAHAGIYSPSGWGRDPRPVRLRRPVGVGGVGQKGTSAR